MTLAQLLGLKSKTGAFKRTLNELLNAKLIARTLPGKPSSRLQKYKLTPTGQAALKSQSPTQ